ncbi:hypothetical protein DFH09DRAFT_1324807 [Mycena vulgaris]|nr:hypothetical protein DFH09DRAFT_1324807 [Mycena vulgaris]
MSRFPVRPPMCASYGVGGPASLGVAETLGDAILAVLIQRLIAEKLAHLDGPTQSDIAKVLNQNSTFAHILLRYGATSPGHQKAPGNALETLVGFCSESWSVKRLYRWVVKTFEPLMWIAVGAYSNFHPATSSQLRTKRPRSESFESSMDEPNAKRPRHRDDPDATITVLQY